MKPWVPAVCLILGWPCAAAAQPLFRTQHDWTVDIFNHTFGLRQEAMVITDERVEFQYTRVFLGWSDFHVRIRAPYLVACIIATVAIFVTGEMFWRARRRRHDPSA